MAVRLLLLTNDSYPTDLQDTPWRFLPPSTSIQSVALPTFDPEALARFPVYLRRLGCAMDCADIVVGHGELLDLLPLLDVDKNRRPAFVIPDINHHTPELLQRLWRARTHWRVDDAVFCGCASAADRFGCFLSSAYATYPLGVPCGLFRPSQDKKALKKALGISGHHTLIYAGRFSADKNVIDLAGVIGDLARSNNLELVLCARSFDASLQSDFINAIGPSGLTRVRWVENPTMDKLANWYAAADVYVSLAVSEHETFGRAVVEAMASGCVPVVWRYAGHKDTVTPDCGMLVDLPGGVMTDDRRRTFTAQLSLLLNDGSLAKRAQLCVKRALRFDSATTMDEFYRTCARAAVRNARRPSDHRRQILPSSLSELKGYDLPAIPGTAWIPDSLACRLRDWWFSEFF